MSHAIRNTWLICCVIGLLTSSALGQLPTYSLEAVELNGDAMKSGPGATLAVRPGDHVTARIFIRDWSPNGEVLRGYQIQIDPAGYTGGTTGTVEPVDYDATLEEGKGNPNNAFTDQDDPDYVFFGLHPLALIDTRSPAYRWIAALPEDGIPCFQDGTKYTCATLKLVVSDDAKGTFTIGFITNMLASQLRDDNSQVITPIEFEPLTLHVSGEPRKPAIASSIPPDGAVDARLAIGAGSGAGFDTVLLVFDKDVPTLSADDLAIEDGTAAPPKILRIETQAREASVVLDRPVSTGAWTTITYLASGSQIRIGAVPGDANADGRCDAADVVALVDALNGVETLPIYQMDIDGNGSLTAADILRLIDLHTGRAPQAGDRQSH